MEGKERNPLVIFAEGATSNGEYLLKFKKGPFASLLPIQPYTVNTHSMVISVALNYSQFIKSHSLPNKTLNIDVYPVFEPNEYFWKTHWEPNQEKEKKVDTYIRCMRQIMIDGSGFKDANNFTDIDRFKFVAAVEGRDLNEMKDD